MLLSDLVGDNESRRVIAVPTSRGKGSIYVGFGASSVLLGTHCRFYKGSSVNEVHKPQVDILRVSTDHINAWVADVTARRFDEIVVFGRSASRDAAVWIRIK